MKFEFYEKKNKMGAVNNHSQKGVAPRKVGCPQNQVLKIEGNFLPPYLKTLIKFSVFPASLSSSLLFQVSVFSLLHADYDSLTTCL